MKAKESELHTEKQLKKEIAWVDGRRTRFGDKSETCEGAFETRGSFERPVVGKRTSRFLSNWNFNIGNIHF